jgi:hypothetical protein
LKNGLGDGFKPAAFAETEYHDAGIPALAEGRKNTDHWKYLEEIFIVRVMLRDAGGRHGSGSTLIAPKLHPK